MKWFGESWGALINESCDHVSTPTGEVCIRCTYTIKYGDKGYEIPSIETDGSVGLVYYHLDCLLEELGLTSYEVDKHLEDE